MNEGRIRMTARRIHEELKGRVDEKLLFVLMAMAEENSMRIQETHEVALQVDTLATLMTSIVNVQHEHQGAVNAIKKMRNEDLDERTGPYVQAEDPSKDKKDQ